MSYDWNKLDKNLIVQIALELNLPSIVSLCQTNRRFNLTICESDSFWYDKIVKDYDMRPVNYKNAKKYYKFIKEEYVDNGYLVNNAMGMASRVGYKDLVDFFISKGANNWEIGGLNAALGGKKDLVNFFISKGFNEWNAGMAFAAEGGYKDIIDLFISKGAYDWISGLEYAKEGGHNDLIRFFQQKIDPF